MVDDDKLRTYEVRTPEGWRRVEFGQIEPGDRFRYKEPRLHGGGTSPEYRATGYATISCELVEETRVHAMRVEIDRQ